MKQKTVNWSHVVCRLCEVPSSHPSQEDANAYSTFRKEAGSEGETILHTSTLRTLDKITGQRFKKADTACRRNQIYKIRSHCKYFVRFQTFCHLHVGLLLLFASI